MSHYSQCFNTRARDGREPCIEHRTKGSKCFNPRARDGRES